ncbi:hypothetical protein U1Q18_024054 [Sarracenia purpurea var. burkii]
MSSVIQGFGQWFRQRGFDDIGFFGVQGFGEEGFGDTGVRPVVLPERVRQYKVFQNRDEAGRSDGADGAETVAGGDEDR